MFPRHSPLPLNRRGKHPVCPWLPECNTRKGDRPAPDFLRTLYRLGRLTAAELDARLRALKDLAAGKLRPVLP